MYARSATGAQNANTVRHVHPTMARVESRRIVGRTTQKTGVDGACRTRLRSACAIVSLRWVTRGNNVANNVWRRIGSTLLSL